MSKNHKEQQDWFARIATFHDLEDGWDSYDAEKPSHTACQIAGNIVIDFEKASCSPDRVNPSVVGGIGITFRDSSSEEQNYYVYIEIYNKTYNHPNVYIMFAGKGIDDVDVRPLFLDDSLHLQDKEKVINEVKGFLLK